MNTTTPGNPDSIVARDHLEDVVDRLADVVDGLLKGHEEVSCMLEFDQAEALAEVLYAGHHADAAARLMHRWVLTEPDWNDDPEQAATARSWLAISVAPSELDDLDG
ncbi:MULTISPECIES: hypothetical protein [Microbacterium]|uniref:hypothetical protein n=1 Tax=Microbacterium TaxID=33882 RepID=UPI0003DE1DFA|nr:MULTISPECIES: hypothetical protein [Microbacterium]CDK01640.1 hypothetical protein MIC448_800008 [Microbacterium sp. C448]